MYITYDSEVDALYIRFKEGTVPTKNLSDGIAVDHDASGKLAGIEILDHEVYQKLLRRKKVRNLLVECSSDELPKGYAAAF